MLHKTAILLVIITAPLILQIFAPRIAFSGDNAIVSSIDSTSSGELVLIQELIVQAALEDAWRAYTTEKGWKSWVAPLVELELKTNGVIRTNYNKNGSLSDASTNVLRIVNYVPFAFLTLQADVSKNWPEFMKNDQKDLYNIVRFEKLAADTTKIILYGTGYKNNEKYRALMNFFITANEWTLKQLKAYLEEGKISDFQFKK